MKGDRDLFGPRLRRERERRGIALKDIAESTKIKESLFIELERNDFSKWPQGIFRRAHLCAYVAAIGLPPQPVLAEYLRLFPEDPSADPSGNPEGSEGPGSDGREVARACQPRQNLEPASVAAPFADRVWVLFFDIAAVCLLSSILAGLTGVNVLPAMALVGLVYSALGSACFAQSFGTYARHRINARLQGRAQPQAALTSPLREVQFIVAQRTRMPSRFSPGNINREHQTEARRASA